MSIITKVWKSIANELGLTRCFGCGNREYLMDNLCPDCWYEIHGRGKHIWEIWDRLGHKPSKEIQARVNSIAPNYYIEGKGGKTMTGWKFRDEELKRILHRNNDPDNEIVSVAKTVAELVPHLKTNPCYADLPKAIIMQVRQATTFHSFNRVLDRVYDFADDKKIWLGFMPSD